MKKTAISLVLLALLFVGFMYAFPSQVLRAEYARQRWLAGAQVHYQNIAGVRWPYLEAGHGPLIILVHGYTGSKENWLPIMAALAKQHRVIAPDLPGWGENTPSANTDYGPEAQAQRLAQFIGAQSQATDVLVGHSMGGLITGLVLSAHPGFVRRAVLVASAGVRFEANDFSKQALAGNNLFAVYNTQAYLDFLQRYAFKQMPFIPRPLAQAMIEGRAKHQDFERRVFTQMVAATEAGVLQKKLTDIQTPVGLLWCAEDQIMDVSSAGIFARALPHARIQILSHCSHMPMLEQPQQTAAFILQQAR